MGIIQFYAENETQILGKNWKNRWDPRKIKPKLDFNCCGYCFEYSLFVSANNIKLKGQNKYWVEI